MAMTVRGFERGTSGRLFLFAKEESMKFWVEPESTRVVVGSVIPLIVVYQIEEVLDIFR